MPTHLFVLLSITLVMSGNTRTDTPPSVGQVLRFIIETPGDRMRRTLMLAIGDELVARSPTFFDLLRRLRDDQRVLLYVRVRATAAAAAQWAHEFRGRAQRARGRLHRDRRWADNDATLQAGRDCRAQAGARVRESHVSRTFARLRNCFRNCAREPLRRTVATLLKHHSRLPSKAPCSTNGSAILESGLSFQRYRRNTN